MLALGSLAFLGGTLLHARAFSRWQRKRWRVVLTGFGKFDGVPDNPTTHLVKKLRDVQSDAFQVVRTDVLEVSVVGSEAQMNRLEREMSSKEDPRPVLWLHLGVSGKAKQMTLECRAYNEDNFRVPDERGEQRIREKINPKAELGESLETRLELSRIVSALGSCVLSTDPGRFLCNRVYYQSLHCRQLTRRRSCGHSSDDVLFVHVPPFDVLDQRRQEAFVLKLLDEICVSRSFLRA